MATPKKAALGRGLDALISTEFIRTEGSSSISEVQISQIHANPSQPRREFDENALQELADSIREFGIIQPVTLRKLSEGNYQIIAGERRWRASQKAGLESIPAYIRTADDNTVLEMALIENIQREDLNAMEIALAFQGLLELNGMTQEQLSGRIGKNRATIANYIRLLGLPAEIQMALEQKAITMGHARAILGAGDAVKQLSLFHELQQKGWSVRETEARARQLASASETSNATCRHSAVEFKPLAKQLTMHFGSKVRFSCKEDGSGQMSIAFKNAAELSRIINLIETGRQEK